MTFDDFERLPNPRFGHYELHHGEVIEVTPPKHGHALVQRQLLSLLEPLGRETGVVWVELGYRPLPEYEYWRADVAFVSRERWDQTPRDGYFEGAPGTGDRGLVAVQYSRRDSAKKEALPGERFAGVLGGRY